MIVPEGVEHPPHVLFLAQKVRNLGGVPRVLPHPQVERLQALQMKPGVERADAGTGFAQENLQMILEEILLAENDATERASLAVDVFGGGMNDDVGAELHRS